MRPSDDWRRHELFGTELICEVDLDDMKHYSYSELKEMTENFSKDYIVQKTKFGDCSGQRFRNKRGDLKLWDIFHFPKLSWKKHPARVHDEIVLLMKEEFRSNKNLAELIGCSCDDNLAVLDDPKFTKSLNHVLEDDGFTFRAG